MNPDELLIQLRTTFPAGQGSGSVDFAQVYGGTWAPLLTGLGIPIQLPLTSTTGGWQQVDDGATLNQATIGASVLGVASPTADFSIRGSGSSWTLLITLSLPQTWTFGQTFPLLAGGVFDDLRLGGSPPATLAISSGAAGLAFSGAFDPASPGFARIAWLFSGTPSASGPIGFNAASGLVEMNLPLDVSGTARLFGPGGLSVTFAFALSSGPDPVISTQYVSGIRLTTSLALATASQPSNVVSLTALVPYSDQPILDVTLSSAAFGFPTDDALSELLGTENGVVNAIPSGFQRSSLTVSGITLGIGLATHALEYVLLEVGVLAGSTWTPWNGGPELGGPTLAFFASRPFDSAKASYSFRAEAPLTLATMHLIVGGELPAARLTGGLDPAQSSRPKLTEVAQAVLGRTNQIPDNVELTDVMFSADSELWQAAIETEGEWAFSFGVDGMLTFRALGLELGYASGWSGQLSSRFDIADSEFEVELDMDAASTTFTGQWETSGDSLTYQDIAIALGMYGLPDLPEQLQLGLTSAAFSYDSAPPTAVFTLGTETGGGAMLAAGKDAAGHWGFAFGMLLGTELELDLTDIGPLGNLVPSGSAALSIDELRIVAATDALPTIPSDPTFARVVGDNLASGLALAAIVAIGEAPPTPLTVRFGGPDDASTRDVPPPTAPTPPATPPTTPAPAGPQAYWLPVLRAFGPLQVKRVGFAIRPDATLGVLMDATIVAGGLRIGLVALEADLQLTPLGTPTFDLGGLEVSYSGGGLAIGGSLVKVAPGSYTGTVTARFGRFAATALGAYELQTGGEPSLFAYLAVGLAPTTGPAAAPAGGPGIFYVTGLAGGFGYNRHLALPATVSEVAAYPLVQGARGLLDTASTLEALQGKLSVSSGDSWLAVGVRFTSFQMLDSFLLVTAAFGTHLEFALLGSSKLTIPAPIPQRTSTPVAEASIALLVDVNPALGQIAVDAQLSPGSYALSKETHLTGGLAFYSWFGPSPHAGDFVVTLGGYNPFFEPPQHYPRVPALGLHWQVDALTLKGSLYFALTPSNVMAGGALDATWVSGDVTAWFHLQADFLIRYHPFQYRSQASVSIGISFTLDLWLTTVRKTLEVSVDLDLWGPPFGGKATIDLSLVSVTITFGADLPVADLPLGWHEFRGAFLPAANAAERADPLVVEGTTVETDSLITIDVPRGLIDAATALVDSARLEVVVALQIPSTSASIVTDHTTPLTGTYTTVLGIEPMQAAPGALSATTTVTITRDGIPETERWTATPIAGQVPSALWSSAAGGALTEALTGIRLVPTPPATTGTEPVTSATLLEGVQAPGPQSWSAVTPPTSDNFAGMDPMNALSQKLTDSGVATMRSAILASLTAQALSTTQTVDVAAFASAASRELTSPPLLRVLGEQRA